MGCADNGRNKFIKVKKITFRMDPKFIKFIFVGFLNTIFGYSVYWILLQMRLHFTSAIFFSTILGVFFNFRTLGKFVFRREDNSLLIKFILVYLALYFVNVASVKLLHNFGVSYELSGLLMIVPSALFGFILNKKFVFRS
jgi:putative flippase GtrA